MFKSDVFLIKFGQKLLLFFNLLSLIMCKNLEKVIARMLCALHHGILSFNYIFNNDAYFLDFHAQKFPLFFFEI